MEAGGVWVFGYGSLVNPTSFGDTLGRPLSAGRDLFEAELAGWGRRWNYGVAHIRGVSVEPDGAREWTIVALGLAAAPTETVNGVIGWVTVDELVALDHRERHYDRVEVTDAIDVHADAPVGGIVVTYVPRAEAVARYAAARDRGRAAIEQRYWDLVDGAFAALGTDRRAQYHATTPAPDVPVLELVREAVSSSR